MLYFRDALITPLSRAYLTIDCRYFISCVIVFMAGFGTSVLFGFSAITITDSSFSCYPFLTSCPICSVNLHQFQYWYRFTLDRYYCESIICPRCAKHGARSCSEKQIFDNPIPDLRAILPRRNGAQIGAFESGKTLDIVSGCGTINVPSALVISLNPADR